jgi:hypothetical protein
MNATVTESQTDHCNVEGIDMGTRRPVGATGWRSLSIASALILALAGCELNPPRPVLEGESQVQLRSIQTRSFETHDKEQTLRTVIATLQDLGFVIDKADATLGAVSATKLDGYELRMTVTVRPRDEESLLVRASAQHQMAPIEDPEPYQDFFVALEKSMFLATHRVD